MIPWHPVLVGYDFQRFARAEHTEDVLQPGAAASEDGLAESPLGIHHDLRDEHALPVADDHQFTRRMGQTWLPAAGRAR